MFNVTSVLLEYYLNSKGEKTFSKQQNKNSNENSLSHIRSSSSNIVDGNELSHMRAIRRANDSSDSDDKLSNCSAKSAAEAIAVDSSHRHEKDGCLNNALEIKTLSQNEQIRVGEEFDLKMNDRVNIDLDFECVQSLQAGHGGWCEAMFEVS